VADLPSAPSSMAEIEIRADEVKPGDYLLGLGRVQSFTSGGKRITLTSEWDLWRVTLNPRHRVVVLRRG
jgi:hypothetical protein